MRLHRSTTYVDSAYYYSRRNVVCRSVCCEPCKNGCTDRDVVWVEDSAGPKEHLLDRSRFHHVKGYIMELAVEALCIVQPPSQLSLVIHHRGAEIIASISDI